jgi:hypothetical protein
MKIYEIQNKGKGVITTLTPSNLLLLNPPLIFANTQTVAITGDGTQFTPYMFEATSINSQTIISLDLTLSNSLDKYTVFINNGNNPVTITIDSTVTLPSFGVGFIQEGTGDVTFVGSGVSLTNPIGLKSKGQGYATYIERKLNTSTYFLLGDTKV